MWCPPNCAMFCVQVCLGGSQGSASHYVDTTRTALKSAKCKSPVRCPSSKQAKIKQIGRERSWVALFKTLILKPAGGDVFLVLEPSFGAPAPGCGSVSVSVQDEQGEGGRCFPRSSPTSAAALATL